MVPTYKVPIKFSFHTKNMHCLISKFWKLPLISLIEPFTKLKLDFIAIIDNSIRYQRG